MSTPFVKFIGVATTAASVVASDRSLYSPCKASLNNFNGNGCVHHFDFDAEAGGTSSISNKKVFLTRVNSTNVLDEGLRIGEIGRWMNSKVKLVEIGVYQK
jgi:hypothetical protein